MTPHPVWQMLSSDFPAIFSDIAKPDPIAEVETAEGMCGLPECGCGESCEMCGEVCDAQ